MTRGVYQVIFRLRSPMHIGWGKVGNLNRTYPYVTGRVFWGALTLRLTRNNANGLGPAADSRDYQQIGKHVHQSLAFTYLYPATKVEDSYQVAWPWLDESGFKRRFLSSYTGTALVYPYQSAATGMLHEVEFISPNTLDTGEAVFLKGYIFKKSGIQLDWKEACKRLQLGGERGYGWGDVELITISEVKDRFLFDGALGFSNKNDKPIIVPDLTKTPTHLLAHTLAANGCDLRLMDASDGNPEDEIIGQFKMEFGSKKNERAVLIVRATSHSDKWTLAGFDDAEKFRTVVIDDPNHELSKELKKEPINKCRIIELATSSLGRTPANLQAKGKIEPLVGREWRSHDSERRHAGQYVVFSGLCFAPGSTVDKPLDFEIGDFGVWCLAAIG